MNLQNVYGFFVVVARTMYAKFLESQGKKSHQRIANIEWNKYTDSIFVYVDTYIALYIFIYLDRFGYIFGALIILFYEINKGELM